MSTQLTVPQMLERYKEQIAAVLPQHLTADRMARVALTAIRANPRLGDVDPVSMMGAIMRASQDGLEPGVDAHLVPYKREVQYIPDYRGLVKLARNTGKVERFYAEVICENDVFDYERGSDEYIRHKPALGDRGQVIGAYAIAFYTSGRSQFEVLGKSDIEEARQASMTGRSNKGPWKDHYAAMAKKTAARRLCKWLPSSPELQRAIVADDVPQNNREWLEGEAEAVKTDPGAALTELVMTDPEPESDGEPTTADEANAEHSDFWSDYDGEEKATA